MTRIVGHQQRDAFEPDPVAAWKRGRKLDAMLGGVAAHGRHGVLRATHRTLNSLDDARALEVARRLNSPR